MLIIHNERLLGKLRHRYLPEDVDDVTAFLERSDTFQFPQLRNGLFSAATLSEGTDYTGTRTRGCATTSRLRTSMLCSGSWTSPSRMR